MMMQSFQLDTSGKITSRASPYIIRDWKGLEEWKGYSSMYMCSRVAAYIDYSIILSIIPKGSIPFNFNGLWMERFGNLFNILPMGPSGLAAHAGMRDCGIFLFTSFLIAKVVFIQWVSYAFAAWETGLKR